MTEIKPRVDDDGVPWCDAGCPQASTGMTAIKMLCGIDGDFYHCDELCPHAVKRMAVELEALIDSIKKLRAFLAPGGGYAICSATDGDPSMLLVESIIVGSVLEKIDAAMDALIAEREG